VYITLGTQL